MKIKKSRIYILLLAAALVAFSCIVFAQTSNNKSLDAVETPSAPSFRDSLSHKLDSLCTGEMFIESQLGLMVFDLDEDRTLYAVGERQLLRPASTMKLLTAITALDLLGRNYRYRTAVYCSGELSPTTLLGDIYIKGMMDPTLEDADIDALVEGVSSLHIDTIRGNIVADRSFMDSPPLGRGWCWDDDNPALTPLVYLRQDNLSSVFLQKLLSLGLVFEGALTSGTTPQDASLLSQRYTRLETVLEHMLKDSDNLYAESVLYQIGALTRLPATAEEAQEREKELLRKCGLLAETYSLADGSGLSLYNYLSAECEVHLLIYAYHSLNMYPTLLRLLPEAGVDGTLKWRMRNTVAQGNVRAKTGTLTGVSTLAGYCTAANGHTLAFAIMNQGVLQGKQARHFQDQVCCALCEP